MCEQYGIACGQNPDFPTEQKSYPQSEQPVQEVILSIIHIFRNFFVYERKDYPVALTPTLAVNGRCTDRARTFGEVPPRRGDLVFTWAF